MGAGRSGSTILGVALGSHKGIFYAGELEAWLRRSGVPNFSGQRREQFWNTVRRKVQGDDLYGETAWRDLESSLALFRLGRWLSGSRLRPRYHKVSESLYRTIASTAKSAHIVDTSHYPLRASEIQRLSGINLYLLYLVRNPVNVVASFGRRDVTNPPKSLMRTNAYLYLTHVLATFIFLRHRRDRRLLLHYEDFVADPESVICQILHWVGAGLDDSGLDALETGIPFQGNRLLKADRIVLRRYTAGPAPGWRSAITRLLQLPLSLGVSRLRPSVHTTSPR
jgi:hypothetical protein